MGLRRLGSLSFRDNLTMAGVVQFHAKLLQIISLLMSGQILTAKQKSEIPRANWAAKAIQG